MNIKNSAAEEKKKLEQMTPRDRVWYIWAYYKFHIFAVLLVLYLLFCAGNLIYRQTFTTRLSLAVMNDRSGGSSSTNAFKLHLQQALGYGKKDVIESHEGLFASFEQETMTEYGYASLAKITALTADKSLDIIIGDEACIRHYESMSAFEDLREYLPEELYLRIQDFLLCAEDENGNEKPVAVSLESTAFSEETGIIMNPPWLAVIRNAPHREAILGTLEYLFD